jgi:peroxiredoxin
MLPLGTTAPNFSLPNVDDRLYGLGDFQDFEGLMVTFICNHCPYVIHVNKELVEMANEYQSKGIKFVAINSNDVENYPEDSPEKMSKIARDLNYPFPYLFDETQETAKAYDAACTPDFYLFNRQRELVYRGQMDGSRPNSQIPVDGKDLRNAMNELLKGKETNSKKQIPSTGCNIKWKTI